MDRKNVREFTSNGKYFGFISSQGKFVVYDVELSSVKQIYTPNLHLSAPITCFTWISVFTHNEKEKNKNKKQKVSHQQDYAAFGTSKGGIALYSLSSSKIETYFKGEGHSGIVTCIVQNEANQLITAGTDGKVIEWDISASKQSNVYNVSVERLSCLIALGNSKFLTGSKQLKLWENESVTVTLTGHTSDTIILQNLKIGNSQYAISASALDRPVSLWSLDDDKTTPIVSFQVDDTTEYICTKNINDKLVVVIASKSGVVHYFVQNLDKLESKRPIKAKHTFEIASNSTAGSKSVDRIPIFAATLDHVLNELELLIGYGTENNIKFEKFELDAEVKNNLIIRDAPKLFAQKDEQQSEQSFKKKTAFIDEAEYLDPVLASKKALKTIEIPMESRLENLSLTSGGLQKPNAKNMAQLLIQGLHSKDASILKLVFSKSDEESIKITLQKLPPQYVSSLLNEISLLMQQKTERVATSVIWLKFLVQIHASQLMALGTQNFLSNFGLCLGIIEHRVQHLSALSKLNGRLDLLINQIDRNKNSDEINDKNLLVYQEEDSDVDSLLEKEENSMDEHWDESADENETEKAGNSTLNSDGVDDSHNGNRDENAGLEEDMDVFENESDVDTD